VRDVGLLDAQGRLCLAGRQNRMIVTQGKNLFAEELEAVLEAHPAIALASVHGVEDARRGAQVVAILQWADAADGTAIPRPDALQLVAWCRQTLEAFKAPKKFYVAANWPRTSSGKTDHSGLARSLQAHASDDPPTDPTPCLHPLS
jgi:acyl-CoA synthetase (AMP-forming)/AMP-acid ligase II